MKKKIELFISKMPKFSGNLDAEDEVDDYIGGNFDRMSKELGIDLDDAQATDDAWNYYSELLNKHMGGEPSEEEDIPEADLDEAIGGYVFKMPPFTGDREAENEVDDYVGKAFMKMADELGIDLNDAEATEHAWQVFKDMLDTKSEQQGLTSTGSTEEELANAKDKMTLSDSREKRIAKMKRSWGKTRTQKQLEEDREHGDTGAGGEVFGPDATVSDATQKNILAALANHRF